MLFEVIEVGANGVVTWYLYRGKRVLYDGEVNSVAEAQEMLAAAKELIKK